MPFGSCNAPATVEQLMELILAGLPLSVCLIYLDDILVIGRDFGNHLCNLRSVLQHLRKANLKLSPKKHVLCCQEVKYLRHVASAEGVAMDMEKVGAIQLWPKPTNLKELQSFLSLSSYYRRYVRSFAGLAQLLHQMTQGDRSFQSTAEADCAFSQLNRC